jgi:hypothetical protein
MGDRERREVKRSEETAITVKFEVVARQVEDEIEDDEDDEDDLAAG